MAMGLANLLRPEPFKCKKKGDSEQLLQDFKQYRSKMELFFTGAQAVEAHTGDPAGRSEVGHTVCTSCRQEKALFIFLMGLIGRLQTPCCRHGRPSPSLHGRVLQLVMMYGS